MVSKTRQTSLHRARLALRPRIENTMAIVPNMVLAGLPLDVRMFHHISSELVTPPLESCWLASGKTGG